MMDENTPQSSQSCTSCRFFWRDTPDHTARHLCRAHSPRATYVPQPAHEVMSYFPETSPANWCGEWKAGE